MMRFLRLVAVWYAIGTVVPIVIIAVIEVFA